MDWGRWTAKNYIDADPVTNTIVSYGDSSANNIKFDKSEIIKFINNFDKNNFDIEKDFLFFLNMINSLGNTVTNDILVKDLTTNSQLASLKSFSLKNLNFDYIGSQKQKFLTGLDLKIAGLDLNIQEISPDFSSYFKMLGYNTVKFDLGTIYNLKKNNDLELKFNIGITDAATIALSSISSGLEIDQIKNLTDESFLAYLLTNFKINNLGLSLIDNSLRDKLFKFAAEQQNISVNSFRKSLINQMDSYLVTTQKTKLLNQYRQSVVNFINGSKKISIKISPQNPVSIAELSPYIISPDVNLIISKLNLKISN